MMDVNKSPDVIKHEQFLLREAKRAKQTKRVRDYNSDDDDYGKPKSQDGQGAKKKRKTNKGPIDTSTKVEAYVTKLERMEAKKNNRKTSGFQSKARYKRKK